MRPHVAVTVDLPRDDNDSCLLVQDRTQGRETVSEESVSPPGLRFCGVQDPAAAAPPPVPTSRINQSQHQKITGYLRRVILPQTRPDHRREGYDRHDKARPHNAKRSFPQLCHSNKDGRARCPSRHLSGRCSDISSRSCPVPCCHPNTIAITCLPTPPTCLALPLRKTDMKSSSRPHENSPSCRN